ncbi:hypothetical protein AX15_002088 [Amanita polypyramis BW_CC]|nr:hypothetical protein AX15_002088 [Amanita polypyramis BW_CC]
MDPNSRTISTLRNRVDIHLDHIYRLLVVRDQPFLPSPFPDDPTRLPADFPDGECVLTTHLQLVDGHQFHHVFEVKLRHFNPDPDDTFLTWEVVTRPLHTPVPRVQLGLLEIDRALYFNQEFFRFTGPFILEALRRSVRRATPMRVVRKIYHFPPTFAPHSRSIEAVEMYDIHGHLVCEVVRRDIL